MKLVEVDDNNNISSPVNACTAVDDDNYSKPRILSTLDSVMNKILNAPSISYTDKWLLYSQALQRYLNHVKMNSQKTIDKLPIPETNISDNAVLDDKFNYLIPRINISNTDMSGIEPIRDSLDSITQPAVRSFFERARNKDNLSNTSSSISSSPRLSVQPAAPTAIRPKKKAKKGVIRRSGPYMYTRSTTRLKKRQANNTLTAELNLRPAKTCLQNWESTSAR